MAVVRIFTPENRLAKILESVEAPTGRELVAEAEACVADLRDSIVAHVADRLSEIATYAAMGDDLLFGGRRALGAAALDVAEVAGAAGLETVGEIARGISAMIDSHFTSGVWRIDALRVHLGALALVNQRAGEDLAEGALVLKHLHTMREAIGVAE